MIDESRVKFVGIKREALDHTLILWRYINFHKFVSMISNNILSFTRMDTFRDPNEAISKEHLERRFHQNFLTNNMSYDINHPNFYHFFPEADDRNFEQKLLKRQKKLYVSSWFINSRENVGMWNLYSNEDGVAISIRSDKLIDYVYVYRDLLLKDSNIIEVLIGKIEYHDFYDLDKIRKLKREINELGFHKDLSYQHENELRLLIKIRKENKSYVINYPINDFIKFPFGITFHPDMQEWKKENIKKILEDHKLHNILTTKDSEIKFRKL